MAAQVGSTKGISEPSYAVYRPSETEAGPSHMSNTNPSEEDERPNTPPPYSGPTTPSMTAPPSLSPQQQNQYHPGLPKLNYALYSPPSFTLSSDKTTITSYDPRLNTYPTALISLINQLSTIPPKPIVRIRGVSNDGPYGLDFDIKINLMNLIIPDDDPKHRMNYVRLIGPGEMGFRGDIKETSGPNVEGGLQEWARLFCEDKSSLKQFVLNRTIPNFDTSYLHGRLLSLLSSTSYTGHITITFPVTHSKVIIHSPHKVNSFFSSVTKVFTGTKKYEVVKAVWPYANVGKGEQGRKCVVQDEEEWFAAWRELIRYAVLGKRKGWVTVEDRLEWLMEPIGEERRAEVWRS